MSLIAAFRGSPCGRSVRNTALWFEPPRYCSNANLPPTTWPSKCLQGCVIDLFGISGCASEFSEMRAGVGRDAITFEDSSMAGTRLSLKDGDLGLFSLEFGSAKGG